MSKYHLVGATDAIKITAGELSSLRVHFVAAFEQTVRIPDDVRDALFGEFVATDFGKHFYLCYGEFKEGEMHRVALAWLREMENKYWGKHTPRR